MWKPDDQPTEDLARQMREPLPRRLGRWFGQLSLVGKLGAIVGAYLAIAIPFTLVSMLNQGDDSAPSSPQVTAAATGSASSSASCTTLAQADINTALDGWTGSGTLTVTQAQKVKSDGSDVFTEVWYIKGSAPGINSEVFIFANDPGGLLVGADFVTREFFSWGAAAASGSPMDAAARATVEAAPTCLP